MVVRIRFPRGPMVERRRGKNGGIVSVFAGFLTLVSVTCFILAVWRLGADLEWFGPFVISDGFFSHGQVWLASAIFVQYASWRMKRYSKLAVLVATPETAVESEARKSRAVSF